MRIPLKSKNYEHSISLIIEVYNPVLRLKRREKEVLLYFLLKYKELWESSKLEKVAMATELFSTKVRQDIREKVKMSEPSYNNHIHQLKKKGILIEGDLIELLAKTLRTNDFKLEYTIIKE